MSERLYKNEQMVEGEVTGKFIKSGNTSEISNSIVKDKKAVPVKPVTVKIEDFRKNLNEVVAGSELPPFLLEMVLGEMLAGISAVAQKEYAQDRENWEKASKEGGEDGGH